MDIKKDVIKYCTAKMNYGKGAGLIRKKVYAEIQEKMKDIAYKKAFEAELKNVNMIEFSKLADNRHTRQVALEILKKSKGIALKVISIGTTIFLIYYACNKDKVDAFICDKVNKCIGFIKSKYLYFTYKRNLSKLEKEQKKKQKAEQKKKNLSDFIDVSSFTNWEDYTKR